EVTPHCSNHKEARARPHRTRRLRVPPCEDQGLRAPTATGTSLPAREHHCGCTCSSPRSQERACSFWPTKNSAHNDSSKWPGNHCHGSSWSWSSSENSSRCPPPTKHPATVYPPHSPSP